MFGSSFFNREPLKSLFLLGSWVGLFVDIDFSDISIRIKQPKVTIFVGNMGRIVCRYRNVFIDIYIDLVSLFFFVVDVVKFAYVD